MEDLVLQIDAESWQQSSSLGISCPIYFRAGADFFPDKGWWDFPIQILGWWLEELEKLADSWRFSFMDGPYFTSVARNGPSFELLGHRRTSAESKIVFRHEL